MNSSDTDQILPMLEMIQYDRLLAVVVGFTVIALVAKFVVKTSSRMQELWPARRVMFLQLATVINFVLYIGGGGSLIYVVLRPPKEVMIAIGGSAAVAIGISLKDLVSSVVAGVILLFDRPFKVGDRVHFNGQYGEITGIGLRTAKLQTLDDNLVTIPNARFLTDVVASSNAGALDMMVVVTFHLSINADLEKASAIVHDVVVTSRYVFLKKPVDLVLKEVFINDQLLIQLSVKSYVIDCRFEKAFESDVTARVTKLFHAKNILRPLKSPPQEDDHAASV